MRDKILKKKSLLFFMFFFIVLDSALFFQWAQEREYFEFGSRSQLLQTGEYPELEDFIDNQFGFIDLSNYFTDLAEAKGAPYAFEVLKRVSASPGIDMHLLGHVVGDILYRQQGLKGIEVCTHDFRNACSHTIVIGAFLERGEKSLLDISQACRQASGGSGAYTMCFHGLGHGVLAYTGYDLPKAVELCRKTGTQENRYEEFPQCVGGTIMEILAGVHNPEEWRKQYQKYIREDDPLYPCSSDFMPDEARHMCYVYITPHLFEVAGANLASPQPEHFKKAFTYCDAISPRAFQFRNMCYGGFGKEFVVLAQDRDIRKIESLTQDQLTNIYKWCLLATNSEAEEACLQHAIGSLYWGGENSYDVGIRFCAVMENGAHQSDCIQEIIGNVFYYNIDVQYRMEFCDSVPSIYREQCIDKLLEQYE